HWISFSLCGRSLRKYFPISPFFVHDTVFGSGSVYFLPTATTRSGGPVNAVPLIVTFERLELQFSGLSAPLNRVNVRHGLCETPVMSPQVFHAVLPFTKGRVAGGRRMRAPFCRARS